MKARLGALLLLLTGCSSLSESECRIGDWYGLGYQDGQTGQVRARFRDYQRDCAEYGVTADPERWQQGYSKGLALYCQPELAYAKGRAGEPYYGVCPNDSQFRPDYDRGYAEYRRDQQIEENRQQLMSLYDEQQRLWDKLVNSHDKDKRRQLRHQLEQLEWQRWQLEQQQLQLLQQLTPPPQPTH